MDANLWSSLFGSPGVRPAPAAPAGGYQVPVSSTVGPDGSLAFAPPTPHANFLARLFGGSDPLEGGNLDPNRANGLGGRSLLDAGLAMLDASGPSYIPKSFGQVLAAGIRGGQQGYQSGYQQDLANQNIASQQAQLKALAAFRSKYANATPDQYPEMYGDLLKLGAGSPVALQSLGQLLSTGANQTTKPLQQVHNVKGPDGKIYTIGVDPVTGDERARWPEGAAPTDPVRTGMAADQHNITRAQWLQSNLLNTPAVKQITTAYATARSNLDQAASVDPQTGLGKIPNPQAYVSAVIGMASTADARAQLRAQILDHMIGSMGLSVHQSLENMLQKFATGTWPQNVIDGMNRILEGVYDNQIHDYDQKLQGVQRREPAAAAYITPTSEVFGVPQERVDSLAKARSATGPRVVPGQGAERVRALIRRLPSAGGTP